MDKKDILTKHRYAWQTTYSQWERSAHDLWRSTQSVRSDGGPIVLLVGDSIARGYSKESFDFDPNDELSIFKHPDRLLNQLARQNGSSWRACFSGLINLDHTQKAFELALTPGDVVLYQDWGPCAANYATTFHKFAYFASLTAELVENDLVFLDGFCTAKADKVFDFNRPCLDSRESPNHAIQAAAEVSNARFLSVTNRLHCAEETMGQLFGVSLFEPDGVHPNGFGNLFLAAILLLEMSQELPRLEPMNSLVSELMTELDLDLETEQILTCLQKAIV